MSLNQICDHLGISKPRLYRLFKSYGIKTRNYAESQSMRFGQNGHPRTGKKHSKKTKNQIATSTGEFYASQAGLRFREFLSEAKIRLWNAKNPEERFIIIKRLMESYRPKDGELSGFGKRLLAYFKEEKIEVQPMKKIIADHYSDFFIPKENCVVEIFMNPCSFGKEKEKEILDSIEKVRGSLIKKGYRTIIVYDETSSRSRAKCMRLNSQIEEFLRSNANDITIRI